MTRLGCAISLVGVLLMCGSAALFGVSIMRAVEARQVASIPVEVGREITTDVVDVDTERLCQITLQVDLRTESVQEDDMSLPDEEPAFKARYEFPFQYTVVDTDGGTIWSSSDRVSWNSGSTSTSAENVDADGGTVSVEHNYDKFSVPSPGQFRVRINIEPDDTYHAEARHVNLNVYDNVSRQSTSVFSGIAMLFLGPVLIVTGLIVFIVNLRTGNQRGAADPSTPPGP